MKRGATALSAVVILLAGCASDAQDNNDPPQPADSEPAAGLLDELYSESLHEGVTPAAPGTAYLEVAGERFEFEVSVFACSVSEEQNNSYFRVTTSTDADGNQLLLNREIGTDIGFHFEDEFVQLALMVTEGGESRMSNSMAQHEREQGEPAEWVRGSGTHPLIRVVGAEVTAAGVLEGVPFAPDPAEAEFVAAATCL